MTFSVNKFLPLVFLTACYSQGIKFDPDFYAHDHLSQSIISERGEQVYCSVEGFDQYASISKEKIKELVDILKRARLPNGSDKQRQSMIFKLEKGLE